jgi:hypothetical protein
MLLIPLNTMAICINVVDLATELPPEFTTKENVQISFQYDLNLDTYTLTWKQGNRSGGPFGPFSLTMSCGTPELKWENKNFLLFERGCGTFCWYVKIFSLLPDEFQEVPEYQRIERPLAFDSDRNLLAYYYSQDTIHVKNLVSGYEQVVNTAYKCEFYSGLCINEVQFNNDSLEYNWRLNPSGEKISVSLEDRLIYQ